MEQSVSTPKRLSLPIFHAAEINLYTKTQMCERTGGNINVQHAVFDRIRGTGEEGVAERYRTGRPLIEGERGRERERGWKREGNRVTNVSSQFAVPR